MPMIDVYATAGTFADKHQLATDLAAAVMAVEQVPDIPMFRQNTAAFIHELPAGDLSNVDGDTGYVRIQVLTNAGALDRDKQLAVVERLTAIAASAAGHPSQAARTWVLLIEAPDGGWGIAGQANTNAELVVAARAQIASLQAGGPATKSQHPLTPAGKDPRAQDGPTIVAGHSYGGQIVTALGTDAPNAAGLVYIAAFALDQGEALGALLSQGPTPPALEHLFTDPQGFSWLAEADYVHHFAADVDAVKAKVMYATQQALAGSTFNDVMGIPAWKSLPSWYLVATEDQAIPPDAERLFASRMGATTIEVAASHVAMVSHPDEVAQLITTAAAACAAPTT